MNASARAPRSRVGYGDVRHARQAMSAPGKYEDRRAAEDTASGGQLPVTGVGERPLPTKGAGGGGARLSEGSVKDKAGLAEGRPVDPAAVARARGRIDSLYRAEGYYLARVRVVSVYEADSSRLRVIFDIEEGRRVAVARIEFQGNTHFPASTLAGAMKTQPEGFWWFRSGEYDDERLRADVQEGLPKFYGDRGYVDFQVLDDTLIVDATTGKATLVLRLSAGQPYRVGTFEIVGNRRFSTEELQVLFPFTAEEHKGFLGLGGTQHGPAYFNQQKWDDATQRLSTLYYNNGYIYMHPRAEVIRRTGPDGKPTVDLRWEISEGQPAIVNKIEIAGNDVTHERVIREAIVLLPGYVCLH